MKKSFIKKFNYFSPRYYEPRYFTYAEEILKYRAGTIKGLIGKRLDYVKWGFDIDDQSWFKETPVLLYVNDSVYSVNNWKMDETAFDKNMIAGTEFIDWMGYYDPVTKEILDKDNEDDPYNFHAEWRIYDIGHHQDRIIQNVIPVVYDETSEDRQSLYNPNKRYGMNVVLDYFDEVAPEYKPHGELPACQALVGLCFQFRAWALWICNGLDENMIEIRDLSDENI